MTTTTSLSGGFNSGAAATSAASAPSVEQKSMKFGSIIGPLL